MLFKTTRRLFKGTYQYKIVLVCTGASLFRDCNMPETILSLQKIDITKKPGFIKSPQDLAYAIKLATELQGMTDFDLRVESPWITIYTNNKKNITVLSKIDQDKVKYICIPPTKNNLQANTIIMPKMDYDYRITMGKTTNEYSAFVGWAEGNKKLKLTKSCRSDLIKDRSWGGRHFYVTGDNNLLLTKMHLGGSIAKIERIIKQ